MSLFMCQRAKLYNNQQQHGEPGRKKRDNEPINNFAASINRQYKASGNTIQNQHDKPLVAKDFVGKQHRELSSILLVAYKPIE